MYFPIPKFFGPVEYSTPPEYSTNIHFFCEFCLMRLFGWEKSLFPRLLQWGQKYVLRFKTPPRCSKNISTYLQYHLRTSKSTLKKSWKITFFSHFSLQFPLRLVRKSDKKNVIFHDFFKLLLNVPRCYTRYLEMFWGPLEDVLSLRTHFDPFPSLRWNGPIQPKSCH